jgi:hypothetical protein
VSASENDAGDWRWSTNLNFGIRPGANVEIQVGPNFTRGRTVAQYLTSVLDNTSTRTAGRRYVFGELDQTTLSVDTRLNLTVAPGLSLELYAQPFLSSGDYSDLMELRAPRSFEFDRYGKEGGTIARGTDGRFTIDPDGNGQAASFILADPDFDFRSLRGNAVLRWEWRPGSTIFLVWQQNRAAQLTPLSGANGIGEFAWRADARELFDLRPDNIFIIKATYWLNP